MDKRLKKLNKSAASNPAKLQKLIDFLFLLDSQLPYKDFFGKDSGLDLFPTLFKLTFYEQEYAVSNHSAKSLSLFNSSSAST